MKSIRQDRIGHDGLKKMAVHWLLHTWSVPPETMIGSRLYPLYKVCEAAYLKLLRLDRRRSSRQAKALPCPVVSVGNLVVGGTGKTPLVIYIAGYLSEKGFRTGVLSRGYGGMHGTSARVSLRDGVRKAVSLFGDEPVLMSEKGLVVYIGRDRFDAGLRALEQDSLEVLILDDGFQHTRLERDLDLVLLDASNPLGNGLTLPFGPLREPVEHLERAHAVILTKASSAQQEQRLKARISALFPHKPILSCKYRLVSFRRGSERDEVPLSKLQTARVRAFSGIAQPSAFFHMLRSIGLNLLECHAFQDHHFFTVPELEAIFPRTNLPATDYILTTEKDFVRLPALYREKVVVAELGVDFGEDEAKLHEVLLQACAKKKSHFAAIRV